MTRGPEISAEVDAISRFQNVNPLERLALITYALAYRAYGDAIKLHGEIDRAGNHGGADVQIIEALRGATSLLRGPLTQAGLDHLTYLTEAAVKTDARDQNTQS